MESEISPLAAHRASPAELKQRLDAERGGTPFLVLREGDGGQRIVPLEGERISVGRGDGNDLALAWDREVSRLHAELELIGGAWTVSDDGLSRNGTFVSGERIAGRTRLRDGDTIRFGRTVVAFRDPTGEISGEQTRIGERPLLAGDLTATQRAVLLALARPFKHASIASAAGNREIAEEVHMSVDAVKAQLRGLYALLGIAGLPQQQKRQRLVAEAFERGLIAPRDL